MFLRYCQRLSGLVRKNRTRDFTSFLKYQALGLVLCLSFGVSAQTPQQVLSQTVAKIEGASGISGSFRITGNGSAAGTFRTDGDRFCVDVPGAGTTWYDGTATWTVNPRTREVTVADPEEEGNANPLSYLHNASARYNVFFSKVTRQPGKYNVLLNPKKKGGDFKAIQVTIDKKTMLPEKLVIRNSADQRSTITLSGLNLTRRYGESEFQFPKSKYKDYEVIDLR